ncbi:hypothetical protein [Legionella lansingensis]|nr:hypothetical protein [Legionella lansingensis]
MQTILASDKSKILLNEGSSLLLGHSSSNDFGYTCSHRLFSSTSNAPIISSTPDMSGVLQGRLQHHSEITGNNDAAFHPMSVVFRGIRSLKNLEFLNLYTPRGDKNSIEDYSTVFNGNYKFISTTKYDNIAANFAGIGGMVVVSNVPKISIDVTESVEKLKGQREVTVAKDQEKDWDVAKECEVSGVVPNGKKSVIEKHDVFMIRKVASKLGLYYGPAYVNPNYKQTRFTIQIPALNGAEFKMIQKVTKETLIDFTAANQLLERLEEMEGRYLEPCFGFPRSPVIKITDMEQAEFVLKNFELTFIDDKVASKLIKEEKQAKEEYGLYRFFGQREQSWTQVKSISELISEFNVVV